MFIVYLSYIYSMLKVGICWSMCVLELVKVFLFDVDRCNKYYIFSLIFILFLDFVIWIFFAKFVNCVNSIVR